MLIAQKMTENLVSSVREKITDGNSHRSISGSQTSMVRKSWVRNWKFYSISVGLTLRSRDSNVERRKESMWRCSRMIQFWKKGYTVEAGSKGKEATWRSHSHTEGRCLFLYIQPEGTDLRCVVSTRMSRAIQSWPMQSCLHSLVDPVWNASLQLQVPLAWQILLLSTFIEWDSN